MGTNKEMDVLLVSRKFPPSTGGMQEFSYHLYQALNQREDVAVTPITWGGSNRWLPLVLPYLVLRTLWAVLWKRPDVVYCTDGLLSPLSGVVNRLFKVPTVITVYGLDITYDNWVYQRVVVPTFSWNDIVACISSAAQEKAVAAGVPGELTQVIPGGVDPEKYYAPDAGRDDLQETLRSYGFDVAVDDKTVLLSVGRLVERKGFQWFVSAVMPQLPDDHVYVICGDGPMKDTIEERIEEHGVEDRVFPLGRVTGRPLNTLYSTADMLIMPNIPVAGDMEGFGLVAMEASSCGTPVVAADMEGMRDSVVDGKNGLRAPSQDADAFRSTILDLHNDVGSPEDVRAFVRDHFTWERQAERYTALFQEIVNTG
jgi:glycosyltransferase involved in cell wall biosynthesis